jgi:hypothetical protein
MTVPGPTFLDLFCEPRTVEHRHDDIAEHDLGGLRRQRLERRFGAVSPM